MRAKMIFTLLVGAVILPANAQDDLYFTPSTSSKTTGNSSTAMSSSYETIDADDAYYGGSDRDVDEYNRHGRSYYYQKVGEDSVGNDIIEFYAGDGYPTDTLHVYPGTDVTYEIEDDYEYSRRLNRYDDYYWYDPWFYDYAYWYGPYWYGPYRYGYWGWYDPWYYGWYSPWYYGWYGWGWHHYHGYWGYAWGGHGRGYRGHTGTRNVSLARAGHSNRGFSGSRVSGSRAGSRSSGSGSISTSAIRSSRSGGSSYSGGGSSRGSSFSGGG